MDETTNQYAPPSADLPQPPQGPGEGLAAPTGTVVALAIASFLAILVLFVVGQIIQILNLPLGLTVTSLTIFAGAGLFFPSLFNLRPALFTGLARNPGWIAAFALVIGLVNLPFANFLMAAMSELLPEKWGVDAKETTRLLLSADHLSRVLIVLAAGVAAPFGEELFFRGWLQPLLAPRFGNARAIVSVAIAFSAIHFDVAGFVARVELGVLFGLARAWSGSLWPAIALHATHNLVSTAALYLAPKPEEQIEAKLTLPEDGLAALVSLGLTLWALRSFWRSTRHLRHEVPTVPLRLTPAPALRIAAINAIGLVGSTILLATFREQLPGAELTRPVWNRLKQSVSPPPNVPHPQQGSGHLE